MYFSITKVGFTSCSLCLLNHTCQLHSPEHFIHVCMCIIKRYVHVYKIFISAEWPLTVLDAGKEMNSETLKKRISEAALTIKTIYWYVCPPVSMCAYGMQCIYGVMCVCTFSLHTYKYSILVQSADVCTVRTYVYDLVSSFPVPGSVSCPTMMSLFLLCSSMTWTSYRITSSSHQVRACCLCGVGGHTWAVEPVYSIPLLVNRSPL